MFKRLLLIGLFSISLIVLMSEQATAFCRTIGGILRCSEFCAETLLKGVPNPATQPAAVCVGIDVATGDGECVNQPLNSPYGQGTPFDIPILYLGTDMVSASFVDDNGKATVPLCWPESPEERVQTYIDTNFNCGDPYPDYCKPTGICVNDNWWFHRYNWTISHLTVYHSSYQWNKKGQLVSISPICRICTPAGGGEECGYTCVDMPDTSACASEELDTLCLDEVMKLFSP